MNKPNSTKGNITVIAIILTALIVGVGVYYWQQQKILKTPVQETKEIKTVETLPVETLAKDDNKLCQKEGFSFSHPAEYICDDKGLWTKEMYEWHLNPPEGCDTCNLPYLEVKTEATNKTLEEYILSDFDLPGSSLKEMSQETSVPYSELKIANFSFVKITVPDMFKCTAYYTKHNSTVLAFRSYADEPNIKEIEGVISTLKFN